jgi:peptidoglycan/LPS O-acetylase OafA/YrhL
MNLRKENHFDLLRFLAAALVLVSHSFPLTSGSPNTEPLAMLTDHRLTLGRVAVLIFFVVSGFLIAGSWDNRKVLSRFLSARVLRIYPGLAGVLLLSVLVGAVITTDRAAYWSTAIPYFFKNLTLYRGQDAMAGVFQDNPIGPVINGSLWTLCHEFVCYLVVAAVGMAGKLNKPYVLALWLAAVAVSLIDPFTHYFLQPFFPLLSWFAAGMLVYVYRDLVLPAWISWAAVAAAAACLWAGVDLMFVSPLLAYALIRLVYLDGPLTHFAKYGDFSYGMYIYAFPVQQFMAWQFKDGVWWHNVLLSLPLTLLLSALSWHWIEKRFIGRKTKERAAAVSPAAIIVEK